jgi:hypothetical protein
MAVEICFTDAQKARIWDEAHRRQSENEAANRRPRNRAASRGSRALSHHLYGAAGEMAVASYLDLENSVFLDKEPTRNSRDLPGDIDVKCRPNHAWDLLVQLDDDPTKNFVLVTIQNKQVLVQGWINGKEAMKEEWVKEFVKGRPCYAVPQQELKDPTSIVRLLQPVNMAA